MISSAEIRQQFLDFFKSKGHQIVPSAPIVVKNDPTLLFTNAGMNQFKDFFLGNATPQFTRVADTQKCLRVSGKHNDLEEVGVDTYHHTMFEMLGNWSFGDYFKPEAIAWSWELLTEVYKLDKTRLYVSVFEGDEKEGLPPSTIALQEWKKLVADEHIVFGNKKDNFWEMGDTGPCGPCSEIHVDLRSDEERAITNGKNLVNKDHPQVIEIWNNVFIQYNRKKDGSLEPLPAKHVDTGMGFERLVRAIQQKQSNYDTDVFLPTIQLIESITNEVYDNGDSKKAVAFRVLADHIRAIAFTISDGQLPSNTGAGYVIRRILRRAVRYYYSYLNYKQPLLHQLLPLIAKQFEFVFPELNAQLDFISKVVKEEEEAFLRTLEKGLKMMDEIIVAAKINNTNAIEGRNAFELFDTYGFPVDLTKLIAHENNLVVDEAGFEKALQEQKNRSKAAAVVDTEDWIILQEGNGNFIGYTTLDCTTQILKYRKVKAKGKEGYQIVLKETPFYAESGGQVGDTGILDFDGEMIEVFDTKKENGLFIHFTEKIPSNLTTTVKAKVNDERRLNISSNHSATHLLHAALRQVLGNHVAQKGSLVNDEQLRFDFSHFTKVSHQEIAEIEAIVNQKIRENIAVLIKEMCKDDAVALGAMALFGEKYGTEVRVVIIDEKYSIELCGGTHIGNTGSLGFFKIKQESAVAAGVRRIEAVSGIAAETYINNAFAQIEVVKQLYNNPKELIKTIENNLTENKDLKKQIESLEIKQIEALKNQLLLEVKQINNTNFIGKIVEVNSAENAKKLALDLLAAMPNNTLESCVALIVANSAGKAIVAIAINDFFIAAKNIDASKIIKNTVAPIIKGGGGGQKNIATAGGTDASNLEKVIDVVKGLL